MSDILNICYTYQFIQMFECSELNMDEIKYENIVEINILRYENEMTFQGYFKPDKRSISMVTVDTKFQRICNNKW